MKVPRSLLLLLAASLCLAAWAWAASSGKARAESSGVESSAAEAERGGGRADSPAAEQAEALLALSVRQSGENHALALETARQSLALWQTAADRAGVARAHYQIARCHTAQFDLADATQNYEQALRIWEELGDREERVEALIDLGFVEGLRGEWAAAISHFARAEALFAGEELPATRGRIAGGLAYVFSESGSHESALAQSRRALDYFRQTPGGRDDALTILEIGHTQHLLGNHDEALDTLRQALAALDPADLAAALCHQHLGKVYAATGDAAAALGHLQTALAAYARSGNTKAAAEVRALIGQAYERQGRIEPARQHYQQALATFARQSDRLNEAAVSFALGRMELARKNYDAAEDYLRRSVDATENVRRVPASGDLTAAFSASVYERYEKYVECLMRRHAAQPAAGHAARAFELIELARARSLAEMLRATQTSLVPGFDPQLAAREKALRQALRAKEDYKVALLGGGRHEQLAALAGETARLEADYQQVLAAVRARHPAFEQLTQPASVWDLRRVQREVIADDETVLIEFMLGSERSYAWAVTRAGFRSYELPPRAQINDAARKLYQSLSTHPDNGDAASSVAVITSSAADELSRMLLAPLAAELGKRRVVVVADGVLNYIPLQVLPAAPGGEPLVATHEVVNAPSATTLGELRQEAARRRPAAKVLAAFGNPVFPASYAQQRKGGAQLAAALTDAAGRWSQAVRDIELDGDKYDPALIQPLFYARRELANLREAAAGGATLMAADFDATRERLLGTDLSEYAVLHFATHGLLDPKRPENSGLLLSLVSPDGRALEGFVGLQDVYTLRAPVDLVVLSACQTGLGKDVRGEGLLGLTRGFMYAGASGVVASLWKVDDAATAELMRQFYVNLLQKGATPAEALRAAQNGVRRMPEWRSPYYWAAFTLQGESRRVSVPPPAPGAATGYRNVIAGGALLTLTAGVAWRYRRRRS